MADISHNVAEPKTIDEPFTASSSATIVEQLGKEMTKVNWNNDVVWALRSSPNFLQAAFITTTPHSK
jgi:hypothetical protein